MAKHAAGYERLGAKVLSLPDVIGPGLLLGLRDPAGGRRGQRVRQGRRGGLADIGADRRGRRVRDRRDRVALRQGGARGRVAVRLRDPRTRGRAGTAAGWLYYAGVTVLMTGLLLLIGGYLESTIGSEFKVDPMPAWAWTLLVIALIGVVLYVGVRVSVRSQLVLALISIVVVTIFFIVVIAKPGSANSLQPFNPSSSVDGWSGIFFGVLLFVGFENAANLAEETHQPHKHIPAAVMITAGIATVFFILAAYVEVAGFHYSLKTLTAAAGAPLFALGGPARGGRIRRYLDRPAARAGGVLRHAGGGDRLRHLRLPVPPSWPGQGDRRAAS